MNARIDPRWIEEEARHLVRYQHEAPAFRVGRGVPWSRSESRSMAADRRGASGATRAARSGQARALFLLDGLARGGLSTRGDFLAHNQGLLDDVAELEARGRRRDLAIGDEARPPSMENAFRTKSLMPAA